MSGRKDHWNWRVSIIALENPFSFHILRSDFILYHCFRPKIIYVCNIYVCFVTNIINIQMMTRTKIWYVIFIYIYICIKRNMQYYTLSNDFVSTILNDLNIIEKNMKIRSAKYWQHCFRPDVLKSPLLGWFQSTAFITQINDGIDLSGDIDPLTSV